MARSWRPLVQGWLGSAALELTLWAFVRFVVPMADELLRPVYYVALLPGLVGTWRWIRPRGRNDRRAEDRRRAPRRTDGPPDGGESEGGESEGGEPEGGESKRPPANR